MEGFELLPRSRVSAKPQEEKNKKIERKVHNDETKGFRDMGGRSFWFGRNCSNLNLEIEYGEGQNLSILKNHMQGVL